MMKTTIFTDLGFGDVYRTGEIRVYEHFSPSNDYLGTEVDVCCCGRGKSTHARENASGTREAVEKAIPDRTVSEFILNHMKRG